MEILDTLTELTKGESFGNYEDFMRTYYCGIGVVQDLQLDHVPGFTYYDNGQSVILYDGNKCIYECNYIEYCDVKHITTVYNKRGLVTEFDVDYESERSRCLYDIWNLKQQFPNRWIYKLEPVYQKYGIDTVNAVRENAHLQCMETIIVNN